MLFKIKQLASDKQAIVRAYQKLFTDSGLGLLAIQWHNKKALAMQPGLFDGE
jgi:hypothetical protein